MEQSHEVLFMHVTIMVKKWSDENKQMAKITRTQTYASYSAAQLLDLSVIHNS